MKKNFSDDTPFSKEKVLGGGRLSGWEYDSLPRSPVVGWRQWKNYLGPGVLLAGASIGAGEWLFGPAVTAEYGATLLWLATISIVLQVFLNLEVMRYTLYCGEPVLVGFFRTWPGPVIWAIFYLLIEIPEISFPFMASNAAVPLAAAMLGHLPGEGNLQIGNSLISESYLVKSLGYFVFLAAFIPLIFGGTVYRMIERVMTIKVILVLGYLALITLFMISGKHMLEVGWGFFRIGNIPFKAETVVAGEHFTWSETRNGNQYVVKGTIEDGQPLITYFSEITDSKTRIFKLGDSIPNDLGFERQQLLSLVLTKARKGYFFFKKSNEKNILAAEGKISDDGSWQPKLFSVHENRKIFRYEKIEDIPSTERSRFQSLLNNKGLEEQNLLSYIRQKGKLPGLDWALLAAFFSIAGIGGISNSLFSNYARDKGWGMGSRVGAIPSAAGGRNITLSHVGRIFTINKENLVRWKDWRKFVVRDQTVVWMGAAFVGMALPCMLSLEFIRNASVSGDRVAAMTANAMSAEYPSYSFILWPVTLLCGFLILAPGQIFSGDSLERRWTDIIWVVSAWARRLQGNQVKYVYYGILLIYGCCGLIALTFLDPLQIAKIGAGLGNVALGVSALHTFYVNRTLLPRELQPSLFMQVGLISCGVASLSISVVGLSSWLPLFG